MRIIIKELFKNKNSNNKDIKNKEDKRPNTPSGG